jgi:hypothetical protein
MKVAFYARVSKADESQDSKDQLMVHGRVPASTILSEVYGTINYAKTKKSAVYAKLKAILTKKTLHTKRFTARTNTVFMARDSSDTVNDNMSMEETSVGCLVPDVFFIVPEVCSTICRVSSTDCAFYTLYSGFYHRRCGMLSVFSGFMAMGNRLSISLDKADKEASQS